MTRKEKQIKDRIQHIHIWAMKFLFKAELSIALAGLEMYSTWCFNCPLCELGNTAKSIFLPKQWGKSYFHGDFLVCMSDWSPLIRSHYQECERPDEKDNIYELSNFMTVKRGIAHHVKHVVIRHWERCYSCLNSRNAY